MSETYQPIEPLISPYPKPRILPTAKVHPRILMTPTSVLRVRKNFLHPEHNRAYESYLKKLKTPISIGECFLYDDKQLDLIRIKASAYFLLDDEACAREAIDAILAVLRNFYISPRGDICRAYGLMMHTAACVYDWTFPLLTEAEREEIVSRCEHDLGPHFEVGYPPSKQGMVTGHGSEAQMFRDWLSLGMATYDEHPDIYAFIAGRIEQQAIPARNFYYPSGAHWQGSAYGPYRYWFDLYFELLIHQMTDGREHYCDPVMKETAITFLCNFRADGEPFREGDEWGDRDLKYLDGCYRRNAFFASALYKDPMLRDYALSKDSSLPVSDLEFLLLDDPDIGRLDYQTHLPRVRYCTSPRGQYVAHHSSGASVYFKVGEAYSANHEWKDCGAFMIYYKGSLASAANCYEYTTASGEKMNYGSPLDFRYNKQTISCNCMLVYDPDEEVNPKWGNSGGQRADDASNRENATLEDWMSRHTIHRSKILFHADGADAAGYLSYCLLGGDCTNAYSDKVTDYRRTSLAIATGDEKRPLAVFVYDRLVTRDPDAKKTWQMHTMGKYELSGSRAITRHKDGGCLVSDTLLPKTAVLGVIGNETERFIIDGENLAQACDPIKQPIREDGRGRLTVSPSKPAQVELFLHAMYVTDNGESTDAGASLIEGEGYVAASLLETVALFSTEVEGISHFEIDLAQKSTLYATNLTPGIWSDGSNTYRVTEEGRHLITDGSGVKRFTRVLDDEKV